MSSLYDELSEKLEKDPRLTKRGGPRYDLGLLLFDYRGPLRALWHAADIYGQTSDAEAVGALKDAVEQLRPLFGARGSG